ncbi:MAG: hypothetical protein ACOCV7_01390, partial [Desulfonatronovibrionaceae bacterium]
MALSTKLTLSMGCMLAMIMLVAATGFISTAIIKSRMEKVIIASTEIRRKAMEMEAGLQKTRQMERDFFLSWPRMGFDRAREKYVGRIKQEISSVIDSSRQLRELVKNTRVSNEPQNNIANIDFYLSAAENYSQAFEEAVELASRMSSEDTGAQFMMNESFNSLYSYLEKLNNKELIIYALEAENKGKEYQATKQRPYMQSSFNILTGLESSVRNSDNITSQNKEHIISMIDKYMENAREVLQINRDILSKFNEFDLL